MILTFANQATQSVFRGQFTKALPHDIQRVARRKLIMIDSATTIQDLRVPPGNRLEKLRGKLEGWYSIRINNQWRIVFEFEGGNAYNVHITDYH